MCNFTSSQIICQPDSLLFDYSHYGDWIFFLRCTLIINGINIKKRHDWWIMGTLKNRVILFLVSFLAHPLEYGYLTFSLHRKMRRDMVFWFYRKCQNVQKPGHGLTSTIYRSIQTIVHCKVRVEDMVPAQGGWKSPMNMTINIEMCEHALNASLQVVKTC